VVGVVEAVVDGAWADHEEPVGVVVVAVPAPEVLVPAVAVPTSAGATVVVVKVVGVPRSAMTSPARANVPALSESAIRRARVTGFRIGRRRTTAPPSGARL
jgi:hypothetical protein